jgi:hypothetical protein
MILLTVPTGSKAEKVVGSDGNVYPIVASQVNVPHTVAQQLIAAGYAVVSVTQP